MVYKTYTFDKSAMSAYVNEKNNVFICIKNDSDDISEERFTVLNIDGTKDLVEYLQQLIKEMEVADGR